MLRDGSVCVSWVCYYLQAVNCVGEIDLGYIIDLRTPWQMRWNSNYFKRQQLKYHIVNEWKETGLELWTKEIPSWQK